MVLEHADAVGEGGGCDVNLLCAAHEVLVSGGGIEDAQAAERRQGTHSRVARLWLRRALYTRSRLACPRLVSTAA